MRGPVVDITIDIDIVTDIVCIMATAIDQIVEAMRGGKVIRFSDLRRVCSHYFGKSRQKGSHLIYKTPWPGDPRVNIQKAGKDAKPYQIRQVLRAIDRLIQERK
jgi:predicted RNA binding protein YcfA (HicA-like mRNA interferase family)